MARSIKTRQGAASFLMQKWRVAALHLNIVEQGWTLFKAYRPGEFVWEFTQGAELFESTEGRPLFKTAYTYYPQDSMLYIDRSGYAKDRFCSLCINERYRVEQITPTELWFYDLEDVQSGARDSKIKLHLYKE